MRVVLKTLVGSLCMLLMTAILAVGYATIVENLTFHGRASAPPFVREGIYIEKAAVVSEKNVSDTSVEYVYPTSLKTSVDVARMGSSVTYRVTVYNSSEVTYWYLGASAIPEYEQNDLVSKSNGIILVTHDHLDDTGATFNTEDWVPPKTRREFYITYNFGTAAVGSDVANMVNFSFGLHMDSVQDEFLAILNDRISTNGYQYLTDVFDEKYKTSGSTVIANVGSDVTVFNNMFGPNLKINVDGVMMPVTIAINRKNMDGNASTGDAFDGAGAPVGCEYTMYITTESLDGTSATVYAISYTQGADGLWYQIGELYEGNCQTQVYDKDGNRIMNVESWDAVAKEYKVTDDISYNVGFEQGDQYDKLDSMEELLSTKDQDFYNAVNNNSQKLLKPVCQLLYSYRHQNGQWVESTNVANASNPGYDHLLVAFNKIKPYCYIGNGAQEVKIQNANALTRAQLVQMLEAIQAAYDYYLSVN